MKRLISSMLIFLIVLPAFAVFTPKARASEDVIFQDDFESYAVGTFPSTGGWELVWNGMGTEYQVITDAYCVSPTKSLQLWGNPNDWSAVVQKHFSSTSRFLGYQVSMMVSAVGDGGPGRSDYVGFFCKEAYVWGKHYAAILFNHDTMNILTDDNNVVGKWTPGVWYNVKVLLDRSTNTYNVWIDGQLKGTNFHTPNTDTSLIDAMQLQSDHPGVKDYFDDLRVFEAESANASPVGYWKFDEGSGSVAFDLSGNNHDGAVNGAEWTNGVSNGALYFDGSDYVAIPDSPSLSGFTQLTLEAWIKPDRFDSYLKGIVNKGNGGGYFGDEYGLQLNNDEIRLILSAGSPTGWIVVADTDPIISLNQWYHVAGVWDSTNYYIYVNGQLAKSGQTIVSGASVHDTSNSLNIGGIAAGSWLFNGAIDEVKIYNYARTTEEIWNDYASGSQGSTLTVNVYDESGFSPASSHGSYSLSGIPINIYTLDDALVASGSSDASGRASFSLAEGTYKAVYGGAIADSPRGGKYVLRSKTVDVHASTSIDLYCTEMTYHVYEEGGPYELNYVDLDTSAGGSQDTLTVSPSQQISAEFSWWELETVNVPVWYVSAFGEWNLLSALGNLGSGVASPSSHNLHTVPLTFTAPATPGTYEIRLLGVLDYDWPNSYYTSYHYQPSLGRDTCNILIGKALNGPYGIATVTVSAQPGEKPVAILHLDDTVHNIGADVWFYADQSYDPDGGKITSYIFDFDDQTPNVQVYWPQIGTTHQYSAPGEYWPRMKVIDDEGMESDWVSVQLTILQAPGFPTAILTVSPNPQKVSNPVTFDASQSYDSDGTVTEYGFDYGDGSPMFWTTDSITYYSYSQPGGYFARVQITDNSGLEAWSQKVKVTIARDIEPPIIRNVQHDPLYPTSHDVIYFYAYVTDNVAVALVQLNYTLDGGATWLLKDMQLSEGETYSTFLGLYPQFQILGFYVIAYDTSGNWNWGSEIVPPLPEPPKVAPIVVSDEPANLLPNGKDVGYNVTDTGIDIIANVTELGIGGDGLTYFIWYSIDGGITWIEAEMTYIGDFVWTHVIPSLTNILFKVKASNGSFSRIYWIIIGPWTYPIYLYFADNEQYYPVKGLDFDYEFTHDYNIADNKKSYDTFLGTNYRPEDLNHDGFPDVPAYAYMNPKMIDGGCLVVEYWIYYAFNNYLVLDNHEHDFESIYLWVDIGTGHIEKVALNQHMWTNNYVFDISKPQKGLNIAVETGGHGMQLLQDNDNDGYPDLTTSGYYALAKPDNDYVNTPPFFMYWTINPSSFVAKLYPWVIYDVRQNQTMHHLFGDDSILTEGLDSFFIFPNLIRSPTGTVDETATRLIYSNLVDLIGSGTLLKTSIALRIPILEDYPGLGLAWMVSAPWYRIQFREPAKQWNRASFEICASKQVGKLIISALLGFGLSKVIEGAVAKAVIPRLVGFLASNIIGVIVDPVESAIVDPSGRVLGLQNGITVSQIPEGLPVTNRSLTNGLYDLYLLFTNHTSDYVYEIRGIAESDNYNFTAFCTNIEGRQLAFDAKAVPIHAGEVHRYVINWTMLEDQQPGVDVYVDHDGDGNFEHTFSSDGNLTGDEFLMATTTPTIQSCNSNGVSKDIFDLKQSVYVRGNGYLPSTTYNTYLVEATTWTDGMLIPQRIAGTATAITSDSSGNMSATLAWSTPLPGKYDIIIDVNGDGYYNATIDALDKSYIQIASGFLVVPEYWLGTISGIAACFAALGAFRVSKRRQIKLKH